MPNNEKISWFALMWTRWYIQLALLNLVITIVELYYFWDIYYMLEDKWSEGYGAFFFSLLGMIICPTALGMIVFLGFIKSWKDYNK